MNRVKKLHPQTPRQARPAQPVWRHPALLIGAGVLALALVALALLPTLQASAYTPEHLGGARAVIDQRVFDYGDVKNNTQVRTVFTLKNVGDETLYFAGPPQVQVVEGCCPPQAQIDTDALKPGQSGQVALSFSMHEGMDGPHDFRVKVRTNDAVEPEQEVVVLSNWVP